MYFCYEMHVSFDVHRFIFWTVSRHFSRQDMCFSSISPDNFVLYSPRLLLSIIPFRGLALDNLLAENCALSNLLSCDPDWIITSFAIHGHQTPAASGNSIRSSPTSGIRCQPQGQRSPPVCHSLSLCSVRRSGGCWCVNQRLRKWYLILLEWSAELRFHTSWCRRELWGYHPRLFYRGWECVERFHYYMRLPTFESGLFGRYVFPWMKDYIWKGEQM